LANTLVVQGVAAGGVNKSVNGTTSPGSNYSPFTIGPNDTASLSGSNSVGGAMANESAHTHSIDVPAFTGASGNGGFANTAFSILPLYVAAVYVMRVK
jgi:hypothetical protein